MCACTSIAPPIKYTAYPLILSSYHPRIRALNFSIYVNGTFIHACIIVALFDCGLLVVEDVVFNLHLLITPPPPLPPPPPPPPQRIFRSPLAPLPSHPPTPNVS
jgi:hypothetical protein